MYAIIVGCGRVGSELAVELCKQAYDVLVIDFNPDKLENLSSEFTGSKLAGDGVDIDILRGARASEACAFIAATGDDNSNLMSAQLAKVIFNVKRVLVRVKDPKKLNVYKEYDLEAVSATTLAAQKLSSILRSEREIEIIPTAKRIGTEIVRLTMPDWQSCQTLSKLIKRGGATIAATSENGKLLPAQPNNKLTPKTEIIMVVLTENMEHLNQMFKGK